MIEIKVISKERARQNAHGDGNLRHSLLAVVIEVGERGWLPDFEFCKG